MTVWAHTGAPPAPHDVWGAWSFDPLVVAGLLAAAWLYRRGSRDPVAARWYYGGLAAVALALLSPLDAMAGALVSGHMCQHVVLILVAAPMLVAGRPLEPMWRGLPHAWRKRVGARRLALGLTPARLRRARLPALVWLAHVAAVWGWHAAGPYQAALRSDLLHGLQHASFLATAVAFWAVVAAARRAPGVGMMYLFTAALQSTVLAALLTFAGSPWYPAYAESARAWGLDPLADQQLAGVLMWVPGGFAYLAAGLALLAGWLRSLDGAEAAQRA